MEIRVFGLVLLLVLSAALPAEAQSWRAFKRKHVYLNMNTPSCTQKITYENINYPGTCKYKNSFIKATDTQVQAICQRGGTPLGGNLYESNARFTVVTCTTRDTTPPCTYSGRQALKYVTVACEQGFPVHYQSERS
ncbi:ribonuclease pancreatic-like [Tachysurus ichikawai]